MMYPNFFESLERRQLLAGVTVFLPAYNGGLTNWIDTAITGINADLGGTQNVPQYLMTIAPNSDGTLAIQSVTHVAGSGEPQGQNPGQIILIVDNSSIGTNPDYPPPLTASLVTNYMENTPIDGITLASLPIHLISTSIGTAMTDAIAQQFDEDGVWVEQETYLDPDPDTSAPFNDPLNTVYDNVEFADDYWRQNPDGSNPDTNPSGHPIDGAYNVDLTWVEADYSGYALAHLAPPAWYDGTIDPALIGTDEGQGTILPDWYENGNPAPNTTGFAYTLIGGLAQPTSGLWAASGGTGVRTSVTHSGQQWPNISDVGPASATAQSDTSLDVNYIHQDEGEADTVTFFLDSDQNPYDGTGIQIGRQTGIAASTTVNNGSFNTSLSGVTPGTYYICTEVTDATGLVRYAYSQEQVTITAPPPAITVTNPAHSNPAIVTGTSTHLIAGATDLAGDALTYTWTFTHLPAGAHAPSISKNGATTSSTLGVTFEKQGGYYFTCTITDTAGNTITSSGSVDVVETATKLEVTPVNATIPKKGARRFSSTLINQFGHTMDPTSGPTYAIVSGPATISAAGIFHAGDTTGAALISVEENGLKEIVDATVVN